MFHFGKRDNGSYDHAVELQCSWHFRDASQVLIGSWSLYDLFTQPSIEQAGDHLELDHPLANYCDRFFAPFLESHLADPLFVVAVRVDEDNALTLDFSGDYTLEVFPVDEEPEEVWRFLSRPPIFPSRIPEPFTK
ncbi:hypothetical protein [Haloferula sp. BvORR071]|uniref:hypothetical protein n=1 Tax=Haloferula sp. BvORR071 TaxID=1396141 RepID=UPI002240F8A7|nr:hypothetical protein [Haloferula sp. BvORR071]